MASELSKYNRDGGINAVWYQHEQEKRIKDEEDAICMAKANFYSGLFDCISKALYCVVDNLDCLQNTNDKYEAAFNFIKSHSDGSKADGELALKVLEILK